MAVIKIYCKEEKNSDQELTKENKQLKQYIANIKYQQQQLLQKQQQQQ